MENASKAVIMAGGMLIAVIILTIGVYIFTVFGGTSKEIQQQVDTRVIAEFNNNFLIYAGGRECTIHDILSLANFANKNNVDFTKGDKYYVSVYINKEEITQNTPVEQRYMQMLEEDRNYKTTTGNTQYYICTEINQVEVEGYQRVSKITFKKK